MHQAADKMAARAKKSIWWPFIKHDIQNVAQSCKTCQERKPSNPPETIRHHEEATFPFQFIHMDLANYEGKQFLISTDQYSAFPHIVECGKTATAAQVVGHVRAMITHYSIPVTIYTD